VRCTRARNGVGREVAKVVSSERHRRAREGVGALALLIALLTACLLTALFACQP
jgi:hypothetical protein